jgi:histidine triad (HIT) family protein
MPGCVFCEIVKGNIPSTKVYEDEVALAFMDINPISYGHTLLIPKEHFSQVSQMDTEKYQALVKMVPELTKAILEATGAAGLNVLQNNGRAAGQVVEHLHIHLIPRYEADGLGFIWKPKPAQAKVLSELAQKVKSALG